jgi:threonyl-tRNA synthetase
MIHRAPFGSLERLVAILIEHTAGNFPLWLSPEHFIILPVNEKCENYSEKVLNKLENYDIRGLIDNRNETISKKIRDAEINKYPFMLIVGDKELKEGTVSVRKKYSGNIGVFSIKSLIDRISDEISKSMYKFEN